MADQSDAVNDNQSVIDGATRALSETKPRPAARHENNPGSGPGATWEVPGINLGPFTVTQPLGAHFQVPGEVSRLVADADREIARGRLESALDLTLEAQCFQPGCIGLFIRQAELLLATGRHDSARSIADTISSLADLLPEESLEVDTERIATHANPTDENVLHLAYTAMRAGRDDLIDRYLPIAVDTASLQSDPSLALELSRNWLEIRPESIDAAFSLVRENLRTGNSTQAGELAEMLAHKSNDPRALIVRLVLLCGHSDPEQWNVTVSLLSAVEARRVELPHIQSLLREMIAVQPSNESLVVHSGVFEVNAGNPDAAFHLLSAIRPADPAAYYVALVSCARAALATGNVAASDDALRRAIELQGKQDIAGFAATCPVLQPPHDLFSIGKSMAGALQQRGEVAEATALLERLSSLNTGREDLARAYADALAKSGKREIAIARLEEMLRQHEETNNREGVLLTIRSILQISPGNLRLRNRLIDEFMKRGLLQEAVQERWTQAQILERAGRIDDGLDQLRKASEVASALGDWKKLESIVRKMIQLSDDDIDVRHFAATKFIEYGQIRPAMDQLWAVVEIAGKSNDPDEAIAALHQIIALGPEEIDAYHKLGEVLAAVGEFAQAERVYRRLATFAPDDPAIQAKQSALAAMSRGGD